jgi:hypothetical protein
MSLRVEFESDIIVFFESFFCIQPEIFETHFPSPSSSCTQVINILYHFRLVNTIKKEMPQHLFVNRIMSRLAELPVFSCARIFFVQQNICSEEGQ